MVSTMTSKGQLTVPKKVRERLKLHAGDKLEFIFDEAG
ncbi:AbrB/MazE/SpoVT family DNA-binding domain-containing protein, partial [bacterium]|nr:AbrB/MazE/SpoVT family DNA-binding domain-containing protein [bacterium]